MWLLNTSSFELEQFYRDVPPYAILSHCWGDQELTFRLLQEKRPIAHHAGYEKAKQFCAQALSSGFAWVWIDTCCINKESSAELSEAINSMYGYYRNAAICYAYLNDVSSRADFGQSRWLTRGWTLQELLAPTEMLFFDRRWKPIGSRKKLASEIHQTTEISWEALLHFDPTDYCVAQKFSWAARRTTTREEDAAYSLFGLFGVNMPPLYGEGLMRAFQRLQEEIMRTSVDMSIFLWQGSACDSFGMLAAEPSCFAGLSNELSTRLDCARVFREEEGWTMNNAGIIIEAHMHSHLLTNNFEAIYALHLHGTRAIWPPYIIFLEKVDAGRDVSSFMRVTIDGAAWSRYTEKRSWIHPFADRVTQLRLLRRPMEDRFIPFERCGYIVHFRSDPQVSCSAHLRPRDPTAELQSWWALPSCSGAHGYEFSVEPTNATGVHGYLLYGLFDHIQILVCLGLDVDFQPLCIIVPFCKEMLESGIQCLDLLREFDRIFHGASGQLETFDIQVQISFSRGRDQRLRHQTDFGIKLDISRGYAGKQIAELKFDTEIFVDHYLSAVDASKSKPLTCIDREDVKVLLDVGSALSAERCRRHLIK